MCILYYALCALRYSLSVQREAIISSLAVFHKFSNFAEGAEKHRLHIKALKCVKEGNADDCLVQPKPAHLWKTPAKFVNGKPQYTLYSWWRYKANCLDLSSEARTRLEWMIFYYTVGKENARETANYFGISRKTFHKWKARFDPDAVARLEGQSRAPHKRREWKVTATEEQRIIELRQAHLRYGKKKLKVLYREQYGEDISTWKIERVVRRHSLYPSPSDYQKRVKKLQRDKNKPKVRIHQFRQEKRQIVLWHTDTVIVWWYGERKVIFTAIEDATKTAFARVYPGQSSKSAKDFLQRLMYLTGDAIQVVHSDNGSEFEGYFERVCEELCVKQVCSRVKTPKDNPSLEKFNRTLQEEWLSLSEVGLDEINEANLDLTEWLVEYNFRRPRQALECMTPIQYAQEV